MQSSERITTDTETYTKVYTPLDELLNWYKKEGYRVRILPLTLADKEYVCVVATHRSLTNAVQDLEVIDSYRKSSGIKVSSFDEMRDIFYLHALHQQEEK